MGLDLVCKKVSEQSTADPKAFEKEEPVITCRNCMGVVTKPDFHIQMDQAGIHTFANPSGHVFEIGCFSRADGCIKASALSDEFSWFRGYVWAVGLCRNCRAQLGWIFFSTGSSGPDKFFGLILDQLIFP